MDAENMLIVEKHFVIKSDLLKDDIKKLEKELQSVEKSLANIRRELDAVGDFF
jgi:peptidoglycan hydrolase CwlO-like protein